MNSKDQIKKSNRKALPKFIVIMAVCLMASFLFGYFIMEVGLDGVSAGLKDVAEYFGCNIALWLIITVAVILPTVCVPLYMSASKLLADWDGEDEVIPNKAEHRLSVAMWIADAALIISFFFIAATYSTGFTLLENSVGTVKFYIAIAGYFAVLVEVILIQQKCVDAMKKTNPEKSDASIYDMKFQKKWMDSCDEAEKIMIGKCAFNAYTRTNKVCAVLSGMLAIGALIFDVGFLPSLAVCIVWIVNLSAYCKEAIKYSKFGL